MTGRALDDALVSALVRSVGELSVSVGTAGTAFRRNGGCWYPTPPVAAAPLVTLLLKQRCIASQHRIPPNRPPSLLWVPTGDNQMSSRNNHSPIVPLSHSPRFHRSQPLEVRAHREACGVSVPRYTAFPLACLISFAMPTFHLALSHVA